MILESTKFFRTLQMKSRKNQKLAVITMCENKNMVWPLLYQFTKCVLRETIVTKLTLML